MTTEYFDAQDTQDPSVREATLLAALPGHIAAAQRTAAMGAILAGVDASRVNTRAALAKLPVTRKHELFERQRASVATDPFGGFSAIGWRALGHARAATRVFQSPGPIYEPDSAMRDYWRCARAMFAAGFRAGDLVHNSFSYHLTPGAWIMESGAQAIGCTVFPGGVGNTELQLQAMSELRANAYCGTPSFLRILLEKAAETGVALPALKKAFVSGEAFPPSVRDWLAERGIAGYQAYATAECGVIAYETSSREGLVLGENAIVEIVRPGTGDPVPDGEVGEIVVTVLNPDYPLVRLGTGDLSAMMPGASPCGRSNRRIKGWMGRADQTAKVRGMFVHPSQVAEIVRRHPEVLKARLVVTGELANDQMSLHVESTASDGLAERIAQTTRDVTKLRADVKLLAPGALPNDGKVIEDARSYK